MKIKHKQIEGLIREIELILSEITRKELEYESKIKEVHPSFKQSARNLVHYRALRTMDITNLQKKLRGLGLSRIARAEAHIVASLENCKFILNKLLGKEQAYEANGVSIKKAHKILTTHTKDLLGYRSKGRRVRIMVTLPSEAAYDYDLVHNLIKAGMNTARINCAHDGPDEWSRMIEHIAVARKKLQKNCKISMDLAGPKIRTGEIESGPQVKRFRPEKNEFGQVIEAAVVKLVPELSAGGVNELPVEEEWMGKLKVGDEVTLIDTRDKPRSLAIKSIEEGKVMANCLETCYVKTGTVLTNANSGHTCEVKELPALEQSLLLKIGDILRITKTRTPGKPAQYDSEGRAVEQAVISCTSEEVFEYVREGEKILFDDGKITGIIKHITPDEMSVEITHAKGKGTSLKADKGINLPETDLGISGLTNKDREDLKFIVQHADMINFSFVNSPEDVQELLAELEGLDASNKLGIILKIETQSAYNNLTEILLAGMKNYPLGVMIARGDLAIESGWENMARIQQEILSLCDAAHVPDVWATQVLETLAKKGIPARSEITDAATALKAECVMLNKGPYILNAVNLLDYIFSSLSKYSDKNVKLSPVMEKASTSNPENTKEAYSDN